MGAEQRAGRCQGIAPGGTLRLLAVHAVRRCGKGWQLLCWCMLAAAVHAGSCCAGFLPWSAHPCIQHECMRPACERPPRGPLLHMRRVQESEGSGGLQTAATLLGSLALPVVAVSQWQLNHTGGGTRFLHFWPATYCQSVSDVLARLSGVQKPKGLHAAVPSGARPAYDLPRWHLGGRSTEWGSNQQRQQPWAPPCQCAPRPPARPPVPQGAACRPARTGCWALWRAFHTWWWAALCSGPWPRRSGRWRRARACRPARAACWGWWRPAAGWPLPPASPYSLSRSVGGAGRCC